MRSAHTWAQSIYVSCEAERSQDTGNAVCVASAARDAERLHRYFHREKPCRVCKFRPINFYYWHIVITEFAHHFFKLMQMVGNAVVVLYALPKSRTAFAPPYYSLQKRRKSYSTPPVYSPSLHTHLLSAWLVLLLSVQWEHGGRSRRHS